MSTELHRDKPGVRLQELTEPAVQAGLQSDAELLGLYVEGGSREAMENLIQRYAPMVASVCRLTVTDRASAEDAFQATFLVLLKSAKKIRRQASVAAWLHGVAYRTASRMRKRTREQLSTQSCDEVSTRCQTNDDPVVQLARQMELETLNRELELLPERLRGPLVEHYLLGFTAPEIAERMELSTTAVEGRLKRGRRALRMMLARRGISMSVLVAGSALFGQHLQAAEAAHWTTSFVDQFLPPNPLQGSSPNVSAGQTAPNPHVSSLVRGELSMIGTGTFKAGLAASILLIAGAIAVVASETQTAGIGHGNGGDGRSEVRLPAIDSADTIAAQMGMAGLGPAAQPQNNLNIINAGSSNNVAANAPMAANTATANKAEPPAAIEWQRPDDADQSPAWLAGGVASVAAMEKNRAVLAEVVSFDYPGIPLQQVAFQLSEQTGMQFEVNNVELEAIGIEADTPVTLNPGEATIRELLRRMLAPLELTYKVTESTIEITSVDAAENNPSTRFYDLAYVLPNSANSDAVMNAIQQSIEPSSWLAAGGISSIVMVGSMMIVNSTDATHQQIEIFLHNLSRMNPKNIEKAPPTTMGGAGYGGGLSGGGGGGFGGGGMGGQGGGMF